MPILYRQFASRLRWLYFYVPFFSTVYKKKKLINETSNYPKELLKRVNFNFTNLESCDWSVLLEIRFFFWLILNILVFFLNFRALSGNLPKKNTTISKSIFPPISLENSTGKSTFNFEVDNLPELSEGERGILIQWINLFTTEFPNLRRNFNGYLNYFIFTLFYWELLEFLTLKINFHFD